MNQIMRSLISLANLTKSGRIIAKNIYRFWQMILRGKSVSLVNIFSQVGKGVAGQIATMLTLIMVVLLVLILITVNIGDVAVKTTAMANAADAGALQLGSQLSTISKSIFDSLGGTTEKCQKTGWCTAIIATFVAIVAVVAAIVTLGIASPLALMAIGAAAGAIGAAVSAGARGITGKAFWNQVLLGASIGAAIGSAGAMLAPAGGGAAAGGAGVVEEVVAAAPEVAAPEAAAALPELAVAVPDATAVASTGAAGAGAAGTATTSLMGQIWGGIQWIGTQIYSGLHAVDVGLKWISSLPGKGLNAIGINTGANLLPPLASSGKAMTMGQAFNIALSAGSGIYGATPYVETRISQAMAQYSRMLNSLGDQDGLREGVFLTTISKMVDDPNNTEIGLFDWDRDGTKESGYDCDGNGTLETGGDPCDSDGDGDTEETVPYFQFWWDRRLNAIKNATGNAFGFVDNFWSDMINFKDYTKETILKDDNSPNYLSRQEAEGINGEIVGFLKALDDSGHHLSFWQPGSPTAEQFEHWQNNDCPEYGGECPPDYLLTDGHYDELDSAVDDLSSFAALIDDLQTQNLNQAWQYWMEWLYQNPNEAGYNPDEDDSYYAIFNKIINGRHVPGENFRGLYDWRNEINMIESSLQECAIDPFTGQIINAPCKHTHTPTEPYYYATIDSDTADEFVVVRSQINNMITHISGFMTDLENLYNQIQGASIGVIDFGGINPVIYEWNDSRGDHRVTVQVAPTVKMPRTQQEKHGNWWSGKKCVVLKDYEDTTGQNTWVRVIRQDPVAQDRQVGILGFWRSGSSGEIDRTAHVSYRIGQVKLVH